MMTTSHICRSIERSAGGCQGFLTFPGVVWDHGVSKPSCGMSDGRSSISHGIELVQATRLEPRGHEQHVCCCSDLQACEKASAQSKLLHDSDWTATERGASNILSTRLHITANDTPISDFHKYGGLVFRQCLQILDSGHNSPPGQKFGS